MAKPIKNELELLQLQGQQKSATPKATPRAIGEGVSCNTMGVAPTRVEDVVVQETGESTSQDPQREGAGWLWWY